VAKGNSNLPLLVILVGGLADEFVRQAKDILERLGVEFVLCDNIYSAVGDLAKRESPNTLIIGHKSAKKMSPAILYPNKIYRKVNSNHPKQQ
jgi:hypothetical protein